MLKLIDLVKVVDENINPAITCFHVHVYSRSFQKEDKWFCEDNIAEDLKYNLERLFTTVQIGRWHWAGVGPHTERFFTIEFKIADFTELVTYLMFNRQGLSILIHPETDYEHELLNHTENCFWLGDKLILNLNQLNGE